MWQTDKGHGTHAQCLVPPPPESFASSRPGLLTDNSHILVNRCNLSRFPDEKLVKSTRDEHLLHALASTYNNFGNPIGHKADYRSPFNSQNLITLEYIIHDNNREKKEHRKWKRNIIWFSPPYSKNLKTNVGKIFFKLLNKHFPKANKLQKILNRTAIKITYCCKKNVNSIITAHTNFLLNRKKDETRHM